MIKYKIHIFIGILFISLLSCEEVIDIDLNQANPALVVEAIIYNDSTSQVRLTQTTNYFSSEEPLLIDDATVIISDGTSSEELNYSGNGYYFGNILFGTVGKTYKLQVIHDGQTFEGSSYMPEQSNIISVSYSKSDTQSAVNPFGDTVFTLKCKLTDIPDQDNFYLIRFITASSEILERYYLFTENTSNSGRATLSNDTISFSESIFYEGGEVEMQLLCIDKPVYNYFLELSDILFWKRRVNPPTPYNPESNINNSALGYFAAWSVSSETIVLE